MSTTKALQPIVVKVINKLNLTKDDLFVEQIRELESREVTDKVTGEIKTRDAVIYVNIKGIVEDNGYLSMKIFPTQGNIAFFVNTKTSDKTEDGKSIYDERQVTSVEFRALLESRKDSLTESIDSI